MSPFVRPGHHDGVVFKSAQTSSLYYMIETLRDIFGDDHLGEAFDFLLVHYVAKRLFC